MDGDLLAFEQRDVLDEEGDHAFALERRGTWIVPHARKVGGQSEDTGAGVIAQQSLVGFALSLVFLLERIETSKLGVPVRLE